ncbi:hypothetical protein C8R43DRAFT_940594 [Mycena crocata]|nr:hypothetical protein C8R43DRAFT_940594 [Mycena crocata]
MSQAYPQNGNVVGLRPLTATSGGYLTPFDVKFYPSHHYAGPDMHEIHHENQYLLLKDTDIEKMGVYTEDVRRHARAAAHRKHIEYNNIEVHPTALSLVNAIWLYNQANSISECSPRNGDPPYGQTWPQHAGIEGARKLIHWRDPRDPKNSDLRGKRKVFKEFDERILDDPVRRRAACKRVSEKQQSIATRAAILAGEAPVPQEVTATGVEEGYKADMEEASPPRGVTPAPRAALSPWTVPIKHLFQSTMSRSHHPRPGFMRHGFWEVPDWPICAARNDLERLLFSLANSAAYDMRRFLLMRHHLHRRMDTLTRGAAWHRRQYIESRKLAGRIKSAWMSTTWSKLFSTARHSGRIATFRQDHCTVVSSTTLREEQRDSFAQNPQHRSPFSATQTKLLKAEALNLGESPAPPELEGWLKECRWPAIPPAPHGPGFYERKRAQLIVKKQRVDTLMEIRAKAVARRARRWPRLYQCAEMEEEERRAAHKLRQIEKENVRAGAVYQAEREAADARVAYAMELRAAGAASKGCRKLSSGLVRSLAANPRFPPLVKSLHFLNSLCARVDHAPWEVALSAMSNLAVLIIAHHVPMDRSMLPRITFRLRSFAATCTIYGAWADFIAQQPELQQVDFEADFLADAPKLPQLRSVKVGPQDIAKFASCHALEDMWIVQNSFWSTRELKTRDVQRLSQSPTRLLTLRILPAVMLTLIRGAPQVLTTLRHLVLDEDLTWTRVKTVTPQRLIQLATALDHRTPALRSLTLVCAQDEMIRGHLPPLEEELGDVISHDMAAVCTAPLLRTFHFCAEDECTTWRNWGLACQELSRADVEDHGAWHLEPLTLPHTFQCNEYKLLSKSTLFSSLRPHGFEPGLMSIMRYRPNSLRTLHQGRAYGGATAPDNALDRHALWARVVEGLGVSPPQELISQNPIKRQRSEPLEDESLRVVSEYQREMEWQAGFDELAEWVKKWDGTKHGRRRQTVNPDAADATIDSASTSLAEGEDTETQRLLQHWHIVVQMMVDEMREPERRQWEWDRLHQERLERRERVMGPGERHDILGAMGRGERHAVIEDVDWRDYSQPRENIIVLNFGAAADQLINAKEGTKLPEEDESVDVWTVNETDAGLDGIYIELSAAESAVASSGCRITVIKKLTSIGQAARYMNYVCGHTGTCRARYDRQMKSREKAEAEAAEFEKQLDRAEEFYGAGKYSASASIDPGDAEEDSDEEEESDASGPVCSVCGDVGCSVEE